MSIRNDAEKHSTGLKAFALAGFALVAGATPLFAQPADQTFTRASVASFARVQLKPNVMEMSALRVARLRPEAVQMRAAIAQLPRERVDLAAVDRSAVPVLVSPRPELLANLRVFTTAQHFTASTTQGNMAIEINGTRLAHAAPPNFRMPPVIRTIPLRTVPLTPGPATPQPSAPTPMRFRFGAARAPVSAASAVTPTPPQAPETIGNVSVERTSYGVDVSFTRFGAVYNVTLDCGSEAQDPEAIGPAESGSAPDAAGDCNEGKALELAKGLEVAGGGEAPQ